MSSVLERMKRLKKAMKQENIDAYIVCTEDFHGSEYVGDYFKFREYLSGFTGSAGTLVVLMDEVALWTDGRYFLQAEEQLSGTGILLQKIGQPGVQKIEEYLAEKLPEHGVIGFDGRMMSASFVKQIAAKLSKKQITFAGDKPLADKVWFDRPSLSKQPVWELELKYAGKSREEKLRNVRAAMEHKGVDYFVVSALDEIAWLLNLRGNDVQCNPVFLSYMLIDRQDSYLYINREIVSDELAKKLAEAKVFLKPYDAIYEDLRMLGKTSKLLLDSHMVNYSILQRIPPEIDVIDDTDPIQLMKAVKTETEYINMGQAHIKDGVAVTRFMYWLKKNIGKEKITELSAAEKLSEFRQAQDGYLGPSFEPIMAFADHGAIVHYAATEDSDATLEPRSFLLADTGGHYLEGTTDITRTFVLGPLTAQEKKAYTLVLVGHLNLANARFLYGIRGAQLDVLAREPLWREGLDFNHGTGHGVGYLLNVHEGPNAFRYRIPDGKIESAVLEEGMITSDEPGFYLPGSFGIRHESLLLCRKAEQNEYGQFMRFDNLTMVPFDWEAIDLTYMSDRDISYLNAYHRQVYESISPYLNPEERQWLYEVTAPIARGENCMPEKG